MSGGETEGTAGRPESVRPPSAEELESKWERASWSHPRRDPSNPYDGLNHRLRRTLSWLGRAEREIEDSDAAFIFLWIAFNAMYDQQGVPPFHEREKANFKAYLDTIFCLESDRMDAVMRNLSTDVENLLNNKYVFRNAHEDWKRRLKDRKGKRESVWYKRTKETLHQLLDSLYALRNQMLHGSATWNGNVNRPQVISGAKIMATLVPHFIDVMIRHPDGPQPVRDEVAAGAHAGGWGAPRYPVVREPGPQSGWKNGA